MAMPEGAEGAEVPQLLLALACCVAGVLAGSCPPPCECKWKSGKEAVLCLNGNITAIPRALDAGTQLLDLTGNGLSEVARDAFSSAGLLNLQKVFLAKCRIRTLDRYAFRRLTNLVELDLSYNVLKAVPSHIFDSVSELRDLKLSGNPIVRILNDAFNHVPQLVRLEMSDCRLTSIEPRAFIGLDATLEWLKLDKNKLANVRSTTLTSLQNLHGLELSGNPWNCSCTLRDLREWMLRHNIPSSLHPVCHSPKRLHGRSWDRLSIDDFACPPTISANDEISRGVEGGNVTLSCLISGNPVPHVKWYWKNRLLPNVSSGVTGSSRRPYVITVNRKFTKLTIVNLDVQDTGVYLCSASNNAGDVQANVTLEVSRRVRDAGLSWNVLLASIVVAILFVCLSCLTVLCVCTTRPKHVVSRSRKESYEKMELNHKTPPRAPRDHLTANHYTEVSAPGVVAGAAGAAGAVGRQHPRHSEYRGLPADDADDEDETPSTVVSDARESVVEYTKSLSKPARNTSYQAGNGGGGGGGLLDELPVQRHVLRKEVLPAGAGSLYTTATATAATLGEDRDRNYPDLLETSPQPDHSHFFSTLPRCRPTTRQPAGSDSQSPLLPDRDRDSRYGSSGGDSGESRSSSYYRLSSVGERSSSTLNLSHVMPAASRSRRHPSLPGSPERQRNPLAPLGTLSPPTETPILDLLGPATTYDYHAAQLERFLEEYRSLQEQLTKMKQTCESVVEDQPRSILKKGLGGGGGGDSEPYWVPLPRESLYSGSRSDYYPS